LENDDVQQKACYVLVMVCRLTCNLPYSSYASQLCERFEGECVHAGIDHKQSTKHVQLLQHRQWLVSSKVLLVSKDWMVTVRTMLLLGL